MGDHETYRPGYFPQVLGAVWVSVVLSQVRCCVTVFVPQGGVHMVGDEGLAALPGGAQVTHGTHTWPPAPTPTHQAPWRTSTMPPAPGGGTCLRTLSTLCTHTALSQSQALQALAPHPAREPRRPAKELEKASGGTKAAWQDPLLRAQPNFASHIPGSNHKPTAVSTAPSEV